MHTHNIRSVAHNIRSVAHKTFEKISLIYAAVYIFFLIYAKVNLYIRGEGNSVCLRGKAGKFRSIDQTWQSNMVAGL